MDLTPFSIHVLIGVLLVVVFFGLFLIKRRRGRQLQYLDQPVNRFVRAVETLIWPVVFLWGIHLIFFQKYLYVAYGVIAVMLIPAGWFIMLDVLAGMVFKIGENIQEGDHIRLDDLAGRIQKTGLRSIHLKKDDATLVVIPYSSIIRKKVIKLQASQTLVPHTFKMSVSRDQTPVFYRDRIRQAALQNVWSTVNSDPQVQLLEEAGNTLTYQVTVYPIAPEHGIKIEGALKKGWQVREK